MAEALGVVASGISVAAIAIQIVESLNRVINFCESIREAPTDIQRILVELQILTNIVKAIQLLYEKHSLSDTSEAMTKQCLSLIKQDISKLSGLSSDLERKLSSDKRFTRTWARVQTVLSEKKIAMLSGHLDRAKGTLQLLQCCHILLVWCPFS
jgi:N-terminal domain on NACHT_NTPase and P-loop NTPases